MAVEEFVPPPLPPLVLVVDDDQEMRRLLEQTVRSLGYRISSACGGREALELVEVTPPDAVLLDVAMPGLDGMEVCRRLRTRDDTAAIPILLVTANVNLQDRLAGFDAGADDYVLKPFDPRELAARLRAHLELAGLRTELAQLQGVLATIRLISHEFNNPLQIVVGGADLLRMAAAGDPVDEAEALAMISDGTDRLFTLTHRLLSISEPSFKESPIGAMLDIEQSR